MSEAITVHVHAKTDVGMRRQGNEDSFLVADLSTGRLGLGSEVTTHQLGNQGSLMIVSDGLGGAAAGEVASAMAVQTVFTELMKTVKSVLSPTDRLKRATEMSNDQIWKCAQEDSSLRGMGATLTAAFIQGSTVYIAQVGDSRAYIVRNKKVKQVTEDQSWANAIKKAGLETKDVPSNVILQALGTQPKVHVEVTSVELCNNDALLLCSDGLSNKVQTEEMNTIIEDSEDLTEACQRLVELANKRGGEDNITVVLARFEGEILNPIHLEPPSITSTFKVVAPLDFLEATDNSLDSTETMSFREPSDDSLPDISEPVLTLSDLPQLPDLSLPTPISSKADKSKTPNLAQPLPVIEKPLKIEKIEIENREPLVTSGQVGGVEKAKEKFEEQPILEVEKVEASRVINKEVTESDDVLELPPLSPLPVTPAKAASSTQNPLEMPIMETPSILADKDSLSTLEDRSEQRKKLSFAETKGDLPVVTEESAEAEKKNRTGNVSSFNIPPETQPVPKLQLDDATSSNEVKVSEFEMPKFGIETTEIPKLETPTIEVQVEQPVIKPTKPLTGLLPEIKDIKPAPSMFQPPLKPGMQMKDAPNLTLDSSLFTPSPFTTPKESEPKTPKLSQPTGFSLESSLFSPTAPQSSSLENPVPKPGMQMKDAAEFSLESSLFSVNPSTSGQSPEQKAKEVESMFAAPLPPPPAATSPKTKSAESQSPFANAPTFFSAEELTANSAVKSTQPLSFEKTSSLFMPPPKVENQTDLEEVDAKTKEEKTAEEKIEEVKKPEPLVSSNATSPLTSPLPSLPLPLVQQSTEEKPQPAKAKLSGPEVLASIFSSPPTSAQPSGQAKSSVTTKFEPKASATVPLGSTEPKEAQQKPAEAPGRAKLPPLPPKPAVDQSTSALFFPPPPTKSLDQTAKSGVLLIGDTKPAAELPTKTPAAPQITKPETGKTANLFSPPPPGVGKTSPLTPPQGSQKAVPPPVAPLPANKLELSAKADPIKGSPQPPLAKTPVLPPNLPAEQPSRPNPASTNLTSNKAEALPTAPASQPTVKEKPSEKQLDKASRSSLDTPRKSPGLDALPFETSSRKPSVGSSSSFRLIILGSVIVGVIAISIAVIMFTGKPEETTVKTSSTQQAPPIQPDQDEPVKAGTTEDTPTSKTDEPPIPTDTKGLVEYALSEVSKTITRVNREMPNGDLKESKLRQLSAFKQTLEDYSKKGIADNEARSYAESALSQLRNVRNQLDRNQPKGGKRQK